MERYFGTYEPFYTVSRKEAAVLVGADNLPGDRYQLEFEYEDGEHKAWLVSRFNGRIGYFKPDFSRKLSVLKAQDMTIVPLLSAVIFSDSEGYWGEMAVIAYDPHMEEDFGVFVDKISNELAHGNRRAINFENEGVEKIVAAHGDWIPTQNMPPLPQDKGTAIVKYKRSITDNLVEQSRKGNKGCYFLSWVFLLGVVALIVFGLKSCGVF